MKWMFAVLTCLLLAGCSDTAPAATPSDDEFSDFEVPEGVVALRGVVVDQTIVPLAGATVSLPGGEAVQTNDKGAFAFVDVEPGVYVLHVTKVGYHETSLTTTVVDQDDPIVRILLESNPGAVPFHEVMSVRGFLECGMGIPGGGSYSTCQTPIGAVDILCNYSGGVVCLPYVNNHRGILEVEVNSGMPGFAQAEAVWTPTSPSSDVLTWSAAGRTPGELDFHGSTSHTGPSPVIIPFEGERIVDSSIGGDRHFVFQVFPESGGVGNLVLQQKVEMYVTVFYNYLPPEGWTLSADGEPERPQ